MHVGATRKRAISAITTRYCRLAMPMRIGWKSFGIGEMVIP